MGEAGESSTEVSSSLGFEGLDFGGLGVFCLGLEMGSGEGRLVGVMDLVVLREDLSATDSLSLSFVPASACSSSSLPSSVSSLPFAF